MGVNDARAELSEVPEEAEVSGQGPKPVHPHQVHWDTVRPDLARHRIAISDLEHDDAALEPGLIHESDHPFQGPFRPSRSQGVDHEQDPDARRAGRPTRRRAHCAWARGCSAARDALAHRTLWRPRR